MTGQYSIMTTYLSEIYDSIHYSSHNHKIILVVETDRIQMFPRTFLFKVYFFKIFCLSFFYIQIQIDEIIQAGGPISWDWLRLKRCSWRSCKAFLIVAEPDLRSFFVTISPWALSLRFKFPPANQHAGQPRGSHTG